MRRRTPTVLPGQTRTTLQAPVAAVVAEGGCSKRLEADFLCLRSRDDRDIERALKSQEASR